MSDKVVLITGTSSGIGLAAALGAARAGFRTVATMRNLTRAGKLLAAARKEGLSLDVRTLDVTDPDSVRTCVEGVHMDHGRLDAVVNNAGAGHVGTLEMDTLDDVRAVMEVNFFGVVAVAKAAFPYLRARQGRLVTVTSVGGIIGQPFNEAYCAAKFAAEGFMESLAPVAATVGVKVSVVEPGAVASQFVANADADPEPLLAAAGPYATALKAYLAHCEPVFGNSAQSPEDAAESILAALTDEAPAFRYQTSQWAREFCGVKATDLDGAAVQRVTTEWIS